MSDQEIGELINTLREQALLLQEYGEQYPVTVTMLSAAQHLTELHAIVIIARQMRAAQIKYFATRSNADLVASKRFEKELDALLNPKRAPTIQMPTLPGL